MEFQPELAELIHTGATAGLILDALMKLSAECVEETLQKLDRAMINGALTPDMALALLAEIAAYRRIVQHTKNTVTVARNARRHLEGGNG